MQSTFTSDSLLSSIMSPRSAQSSRQYMSALNPSRCSCARQSSKMTQHLNTCELKPLVASKPHDVVKLYRLLVQESKGRSFAPLLQQLESKCKIRFDMDQLGAECEEGVFKLLHACDKIKAVEAWSSLVKISDVDNLRTSKTPEEANLLHAAVMSFYSRISKFRKEHPGEPATK